VLVYVSNITPRVTYVLHFLSQYFGHPFTATTDKDAFSTTGGSGINYSKERLSANELLIHPSPLLFESRIRPVITDCFHVKGYKAFFQSEGDWPFDLFAAIFFLLSRYEEYYEYSSDEYGRYPHTASLAFRERFLNQPLVNTWLEDFRLTAREKLGTVFPAAAFKLQPTYDIDIAWSYRAKGRLRNTGGAVRSLLRAEISGLKERIQVVLKQKADPYDSYEWMDALHKEHGVQPMYFFHVGSKRNKYDKNIDPANPLLKDLIRNKSATGEVGVHPSWASVDHPYLLTGEKQRLEEIIGKPVTASRQHYIRLTLPYTLRLLEEAGIQDEYSMGYGSINGFRASVAHPFYWYDLQRERITNLLLHPFCFMDANSFFEQKQNATQTALELQQYLHSIRAVNGTMITIWHNTFLGTDPRFAGWREVYAAFIRAATASSSKRG
jgi:hypothetical protein